MAFKYKTAKGSASLSETPFCTGRIQNERIMPKKETYAFLVDEVGGKKADHAAAWKGLAKAIMLNSEMGNAARVDGLGTFRNTCKGAFEGSSGPWVKGRNLILIACNELNEFKNALRDVVPVNNTQGDRPAITSVLNLALDEYDQVRVGDEMSMAGTNLAPDTEKPDEFVALYKGDSLVVKATVTKSELNTVEFKFEGVALEAGDYKVVIFTRCGDPEGQLLSDSRKVKYESVVPSVDDIASEGHEGEIVSGTAFAAKGSGLDAFDAGASDTVKVKWTQGGEDKEATIAPAEVTGEKMSFEFPDALVGVPVDTELTFEIHFGETVKTKGSTLVEE